MLSLAKGQSQERGPGRERWAPRDMLGLCVRWSEDGGVTKR